MSDEQMDDIFRELQDDLAAVRPSPEFAAKVRQRVASAPERRWFGVWQIATAASIVTVAVLAFVFWRSQVKHVEAPTPVVVTAQNPPTPSPSAASSTGETTLLSQKPEARSQTVAALRTRPNRSHEPEVLVPSDQADSIRRFMTAIRSGVNASAQVTSTEDPAAALPPLKLIEIEPITVELLPGTPDGRGGRREQR
jgi:hypothetical protein